MKRTVLTIAMAFFALAAYSQAGHWAQANEFSMDVQLRSRAEYRNGALYPRFTGEHPAFFINERSRVSLGYKRDLLSIGVSGQHVGVWGQDPQIDRNGRFMLNEAWARIDSRNGFFAKLGRQSLVYDDQRLLGSLDWNVSGRFFDAVKLGYEAGDHKAHLILAFNQNDETIIGGTYYRPGGQPFKTMQTAWYNYDGIRDLNATLLLINLGKEIGDGRDDYGEYTGRSQVHYMQTFGTHLTYNPDNYIFKGTFYYQTGKTVDGETITAAMVGVEAMYRFNARWQARVGSDWLSGDSGNNPGKARAFDPLYGTHHKFYGAMDYFYASSFIDGYMPGLNDQYGGITYSPCDKVDIMADYHYFSVAKKVYAQNGDSFKKYLGSEIDLQVNWKIMPDVSLSAGYSIMLGTDTMKQVKGGNPSHWQDWGWISININPRIFSSRW